MIKTSFATAWVIICTAAFLIAYDFYAFRTRGKGDTISEVILSYSLRHPVIPFIFGVLMGHFFWPQVVSP